MKPAAAFSSILLAILTVAGAAGAPPPPPVEIDADWATAQSAYLVGRWAWSTPISINIKPESGTIEFAPDGTYEADMARGRWTLKPIAEGLFDVTLTSASGSSRRLAFRIFDATTMHSETEDLTYRKVD